MAHITLREVAPQRPDEVRATFEVLTASDVVNVLMDIAVAPGVPPRVVEFGVAASGGVTSVLLRELPIDSMVQMALADMFTHEPIDCDGPVGDVIVSIAAAYRDAVMVGQPPLAVLMRLTGRSHSTVTRLAERARTRGLLTASIYDRPKR